MDKDALDIVAAAIAGRRRHNRVGNWDREDALAASAALGANGYVVVPRHLLDELAAEANVYVRDTVKLGVVRAALAVVEAVGPTREDTK